MGKKIMLVEKEKHPKNYFPVSIYCCDVCKATYNYKLPIELKELWLSYSQSPEVIRKGFNMDTFVHGVLIHSDIFSNGLEKYVSEIREVYVYAPYGFKLTRLGDGILYN